MTIMYVLNLKLRHKRNSFYIFCKQKDMFIQEKFGSLRLKEKRSKEISKQKSFCNYLKLRIIQTSFITDPRS